MFDTHCHLQFDRFEGKVDEVIQRATEAGVTHIVSPGTDAVSSHKAVEIAAQYEHVYAAVGIHPHDIYQIQIACKEKGYCDPINITIEKELEPIRSLIKKEKVVALGEIGLDNHEHKDIQTDEQSVIYQKEFFMAQIKLALEFKKPVIIHNREAKKDMLPLLTELGNTFDNKMVFHCCEPDEEILAFANDHKIFIGVDGDITYDTQKQEFLKKVPLDHLVLETDSPFLLPEPLRTQKQFPNEPKNLALIAEFVADVLKIDKDKLIEETTKNAFRLFQLPT